MKNIADENCRENKKKICSIIFFPKIVPLIRQCEKYWRAGQAINDIWRTSIAFWIPKSKNTHSEQKCLLICTATMVV